jgi:Carboxypeptidase regulatory-like domain/TonB-dependent Receptor Plug Domain
LPKIFRTYELYAALLSLILLTSDQTLARQAASLSGRVLDSVSGDVLPGATVALVMNGGKTTGAVADGSGRYLFSRLSAGNYRVMTSFVGYVLKADSILVEPGIRSILDILLEPAETRLKEVVVESRRDTDGDFVAGLETITPGDLATVPMPDVSYDLAGYLVTLPGIVSAGDRGGQLFVRGGTPTQNLVLLDGIPIFQPFHIVGFYSAFPADIISYADVYAGGFGARYGGRISSVIDIGTRNGDKNRVQASGSIAPFLTGLSLSVPVVPEKVSLLLSVRESLIERIAPDLYGENLPFRFGDQFLKLHAFLSKTSSFSATVLRTFDEGNITAGRGKNVADNRRSTWKNQAYGFRYMYLPAQSPVMTELAVNYSKLSSRYRQTLDETRIADVSEFDLRIMFGYLLGNTQIHFGIVGSLNTFQYDLGRRQLPIDIGETSGGAFFDARYLIGGILRIEPGIRIESFSRGQGTTLGPRLRAVVLPWGSNSRHQFSFAWGRYHQQLVGLNNEQDVSDVFTIWTASPDNQPVPAATHLIAGWQGRFFPWLETKIEGYTKKLDNLAFPVFSDRITDPVLFSSVHGRARGVDAKIEINTRRIFATLGYSLARVDYRRNRQRGRSAFFAGFAASEFLDDAEFNPPHDRRHQINLTARVDLGAGKLGVRWQFGSGLPFTQVNGYFKGLTPVSPTDTGFRTEAGDTFVSRSDLYGGRLPTYHRMDISFERTFLLERADVTLQLGAINVYGRDNIFEYNIFSGERVNQLPFIPSAGIKVSLR